jgi:type II secretory pathway pseudopilin PulG
MTLVELIVVMAIIAGLAALVLLILPRLQDSQRTAKGADIVQGQLFVARQMALRDQLPRGVRLVSTGNFGNRFDQLQLIEQPPAYTTGVVRNLILNPNTTWPQDPTTGWFVIQFNPDPITGAQPDFSNGAVQPGDLLDLSAANDNYTVVSPPASGAMHLIMKVQLPTAVSPPMVWVLSQPQITYTGSPFPFYYRIIRSPRALTGEAPITLPNGIVVDASNSSPTPGLSIIPQDTDGNFEVLFDPSGKVLRAAGNQGKVVLWVMDVSNNNNQFSADQTLIAVYSRTGVLMAAPVNISDPTNYYKFVKDGATSGM